MALLRQRQIECFLFFKAYYIIKEVSELPVVD